MQALWHTAAFPASRQGMHRFLQGCLSSSLAEVCHLQHPKTCSGGAAGTEGGVSNAPRCALCVRNLIRSIEQRSTSLAADLSEGSRAAAEEVSGYFAQPATASRMPRTCCLDSCMHPGGRLYVTLLLVWILTAPAHLVNGGLQQDSAGV